VTIKYADFHKNMLTSISIKNLAIVEQLELDLSTGMSALTGETGAGKSILIDALGLALGNKADKGMVRNGSKRAEINAVFDITGNYEALGWLQRHELDDGHECILRRVVTTDNRSKAFINGTPATLKLLQSLGTLLVEIHGQHAHQRLLSTSFQLTSLDQFAGHNQLLESSASAFSQWHKTRQQYQQLLSDEQDRASRLDLLEFQFQELQQLNLQPGETQQLENDFKTLSNADKLIQGCYALSSQLYDDDNAIHNVISSLQNRLTDLTGLDTRLSGNVELLESALINIHECSNELRHFADALDTDDQTLGEVESRLQTIYEMSRKYRLEPEALCQKAEDIEKELDQLKNTDAQIEQLQRLEQEQQQTYLTATEELHQSRVTAAATLTASTIELLRTLAMPEVRFEIAIEKLNVEKASKTGLDRIEFLVSANPGQPVASLKKVASGGELSRISLAIQVATMNNINVPTLIFDEVDVGIGGGTAEIVGRLLRKLGTNQQVLCVTHLPQVAAQAHQHLNVAKTQTSDSTTTTIGKLEENERIREIARMLGGLELTDQTMAHAREMLETA
jgi:DNA repair protein RecN (Recombination protein N)